MQGIYTHIPETDYVPREYGVAAILLFLFMVLISLLAVLNLLYFYISTFRSTCAVSNMAVFCSSLTSWFPGMLLTYFLNVFEIVPIAPIITGITFVLLLLLLFTAFELLPGGSGYLPGGCGYLPGGSGYYPVAVVIYLWQWLLPGGSGYLPGGIGYVLT